ncbi:AraC family transcriptional regulator [Clostridium carboxidivorans P7]|uniref:Transcriptional regulator, AraC family n=1 Tax=Clostridium carboxidivorans P7 TaxID=536227 RepID=C6PVM8_9CLOT|nr:AraC family transcriptional regulator [Clostridium carboxidivorans]AKN30226.1 AraC family transcriptional regulator [Clostridium carboxidivorans P7]EET86725.1 transcriptional regulator, AraC family [Clostridium carboxidivorans P7]
MITNKLVNQSIDYIMRHLDEEISIEDVADYCHFSKYYFSRVFKKETGESIYAFIKRLKMEQSALNLKIEKDKSITDIGYDYGYSPSNYSSAFKKHHNISPAEFRKSKNTTCVPHPFYQDKLAKFQSFEEYDQRILIQELDDFVVIYERYIGNYIELGKNWYDFTEKYKDYFKEDTLLIERFYDDPSITSLDQCLYDICMTVDKNCSLDNVTTIQGGKFALCRFDGLIQDIFAAFQGVFNIWLPDSGYEMDERYGLDIYRAIDWESMHVVMDLCIPIK